MTNDENAPLFKYKANVIATTEADRTKKGVKTDASLKYLSNFWRSLKYHWLIAKLSFH